MTQAWRTQKRQIQGLVKAELRPRSVAIPRSRGAKAKGRTFERRAQRHIMAWAAGKIYNNPWIFYEDANGFGWAQPDTVVIGKTNILFEMKLTGTREQYHELYTLYAPLVAKIWPGSWKYVAIYKYFGYTQGLEIDSIDDILSTPGRLYSLNLFL